MDEHVVGHCSLAPHSNDLGNDRSEEKGMHRQVFVLLEHPPGGIEDRGREILGLEQHRRAGGADQREPHLPRRIGDQALDDRSRDGIGSRLADFLRVGQIGRIVHWISFGSPVLRRNTPSSSNTRMILVT